MPIAYGAVSERDAEEGGHIGTLPLRPGLFEPVLSQVASRRTGWKTKLVGFAGAVAGCLLVASFVQGGGQEASTGSSQSPQLLPVLPGKQTELSALVHDFKTDFQKLVNIQDWGTVNPETGIIRVQCDDTVAEGRCVRVRKSEKKALMRLFPMSKSSRSGALA